MSEDVQEAVLLTMMGLSAISTLSFPILFSRYNWRKTPIGRALMIKASSTAASITLVFLLNVFQTPHDVRIVVYALAFTAIGISSFLLTRTMLNINHEDRIHEIKQKDEVPK